MNLKFLIFGLIGMLIAVLIYSAFEDTPTITIKELADKNITAQKIDINLSEPEAGRISGVLDGPTIINITGAK